MFPITIIFNSAICFLGSNTSTEGGFTRLQLFHVIKNIFKEDVTNIYSRIEQFFSEKRGSEYILSDDEKGKIKDLVFKMRTRWNECARSEHKFKKKIMIDCRNLLN